MTLASAVPAGRARSTWLIAGLALLVYAVLGNWLVLPGYRRFLAGESSGADGLVLVWGASRTILWMLSFHLGAFCIAWAALSASQASRTFRRGFAFGAALWIAVWALPRLPGPYVALFAGVGVVTLLFIVTTFGRATLGQAPFADGRGGHWRIASAFFFALATWDACGLGSVGGILRPDSVSRAANHVLVVTQTTKLIVEFAIAWGLLAASAFPNRRPAP